MKIVFGFLSACFVSGVAGFANAATVTETFDTAASAAANGWVVVGSGVDNNVAGWINTNDAGGVAGEAQADFRRSTGDVYYADTNLGLSVSGNAGFTFSGKMDILSIIGTPDFGNHARMTYFSASDLGDRLGIVFTDDGFGVLRWGIVLDVDGNFTWASGFVGTTINNAGTNVDRTFSFTYDPTIGNGQITASVSGAGGPVIRNLTAGERTQLNGLSLDAFGFFKPTASGTQDIGANFRFDDVTYTHVAVPEPSSIVMAFAAIGSVMYCAMRRKVS